MIIAPYGWLTLCGIAVSLAFWRRLGRRDPRLLTIYLAALAGAFLGAKLVYLCAEGYLHLNDAQRWRELATGKSILGGLLGGYLTVETVKRILGYKGVTGDWFAIVVPVGIFLGRVGCWTSGCCAGIPCSRSWYTMNDASGQARWPAVPFEMLFNIVAIVAVLWLRRTHRLEGQHFHLYLIAYGTFRFFHEFVREEPRILFAFTGYQIAALSVLALGMVRFIQRKSQNAVRQPIACLDAVS